MGRQPRKPSQPEIFIDLKAIQKISAVDHLYLLGLAMRDAPLGDCRSAATRLNDEVAFAGDSRQGDDAVESKEAHAHSIQTTTCI